MEVFVFPLVNVTLFPRTTKPLNIFEPRYLKMVKDSLQKQKPIAIGFVEDPLKVNEPEVGAPVSFVREIAGYGIPQIIEERANGTLLIFLQGHGKLRLGRLISKEDYLVCEGAPVIENLQVQSEKVGQLHSLHKVLIRWLYTHIPDANQREVFLRNVIHPEEVVGAFSSYLVRDYDLQQMVLELDDINDKIEFLYRLVESNELTS